MTLPSVRRLIVLAAAVGAPPNGRAEASCASGTVCLCSANRLMSGQETVYEVVATSVTSETVIYEVTATHGLVPDGGPPTTLTRDTTGWERRGFRYLVFDPSWGGGGT